MARPSVVSLTPPDGVRRRDVRSGQHRRLPARRVGCRRRLTCATHSATRPARWRTPPRSTAARPPSSRSRVPLHAASLSQRRARARARRARSARSRGRRTPHVARRHRARDDRASAVASRVVNSLYANLGVHPRQSRSRRRCSRARDRTSDRGSATARSRRRRSCDWAAPTSHASSSSGTRASSTRTARCRAASTRAAPTPCPEHDSHGEFIYLAAEYWRHTHDRAVADRDVA